MVILVGCYFGVKIIFGVIVLFGFFFIYLGGDLVRLIIFGGLWFKCYFWLIIFFGDCCGGGGIWFRFNFGNIGLNWFIVMVLGKMVGFS